MRGAYTSEQPISPTPGPVKTRAFVATKGASKGISLGTKAGGPNDTTARKPGGNPMKSKSKRKRY